MIKVNQKVRFDPFLDIGGNGAKDLQGYEVTGKIVAVHHQHKWFSVEYGPKLRTSFKYCDIGKAVRIIG